MKVGVVTFPGSNCDADSAHAVEDVLREDVVPLWHEADALPSLDLVILPGGFTYGDYWRTGAMAKFSPILKPIREFAKEGGLVLGICNGFQILVEAGLLPGAFLKNVDQHFVCDWVSLRVENPATPFTRLYRPGEVIRMPVAHGEGRYYLDEAGLKTLELNQQVVFRYVDNVNGSVNSIAGICNFGKNVLGLMPHPERCCEALLGGIDGLRLFQSAKESPAAHA